jgi:putative ABC transport system substrate-binding protein
MIGSSAQHALSNKNIGCMRTGAFALVCLMLCFVLPALTEAQSSSKVPRIGYVAPLSPASEAARIEPFRHGLRDLGYLEGTNILVDFRYAGGKPDSISAIVADLVEMKADILVTEGLAATRAAKKLTKEIPIITVTSADLVQAGIVISLARPGANITGLTRLTRELGGKRLELFKEMIPRMSRVGILLATGGTAETAAMGLKEYEIAGRALNIGLQVQKVGAHADLADAFEAFVKDNSWGVVVSISPLIRRHTKIIAELAMKNRLPSCTRQAASSMRAAWRHIPRMMPTFLDGRRPTSTRF